ncbi:hypothetical protein HMPREF9514_01030 [Enterococcus faecalis TX0855]|nr:hypothetical protein HMPREF9514_01030 [Enterococcus faecalis TX0855]
MLFNFWRISAYFRRSCFCSRRLSVLSVEQKSKVIFVPRSFLLGPRTDFLSLIFQKDYKRVMIVLRVRKKGDK